MNQAWGGPPGDWAVPVLPATVNPGTAAPRPVPAWTTSTIIRPTAAAVAGETARFHVAGSIVRIDRPSGSRTSRAGCRGSARA